MKRFIFAITVLVFAFASLSVAKPAKAKAGPKPARTAAKAVKKSEVKDARDGQVYRVVNIAEHPVTFTDFTIFKQLV